DEARRLNHRYIGTEHLLQGILFGDEGIAIGTLEYLGVSLEKARIQTVQELSRASAPAADVQELNRASAPAADVYAENDNQAQSDEDNSSQREAEREQDIDQMGRNLGAAHKSYSNFSDMLEDLRKSRNITKKDLAKATGLTPAYISQLTLGMKTTPSIMRVTAL